MKVHWHKNDAVDENAVTVLPKIAAAYFSAGTALFKGEQSPEKLHSFRLKTKHFRYTLELFKEQYGPELAPLVGRLKPVQDALGEINDCATVQAWLTESDPVNVKQFLSKRIAEKSKRFEAYWKTTFDKPGQRRRWIRVLGRV